MDFRCLACRAYSFAKATAHKLIDAFGIGIGGIPGTVLNSEEIRRDKFGGTGYLFTGAAPGMTLVPDLGRSDHAPFWDAELPAVLWTDTGNFRNPNYHAVTDTPDTLDYAFMSEVAHLVCRMAERRP